MGCNSEHMAASGYERELSRVACLLDELAGKKWERNWWDGYHPRVYCKDDRAMGDRMVKELCEALQASDVAQCSLEMQIWWRDHQAVDKARCERDMAQATTDAERAAALAKLTPAERRLLGL
jgi:hypothetical protein